MLFIHDPLEKTLPPAGIYRISDGSNEVTLDTADPARRQAYHSRFHERQMELKHFCIHNGIHFLPCTTSGNLLLTLLNGLGLQPQKGAA